MNVEVFTDFMIYAKTYLIINEGEALIIDPHKDDDLVNRIKDLKRIHVLLTHEHYDHISGVNSLRAKKNCIVYASTECSSVISSPDNGTVLYPLMFIADRHKYKLAKKLDFPYTCTADVSIEDGSILTIMNMSILAWNTPGHSPGGMSYLIDDMYLFPGDNLLGNGMELKSLNSDENDFRRTIRRYFDLCPDITVFPGHGDTGKLIDCLRKVKDYYNWA